MEETLEYRHYPILQYRHGDLSETQDVVAAEYDLTIFVNDKEFITLLCTPRSLENLVVGFLVSEGVIRSFGDLESVEVDVAQKQARVRLLNEDSYVLSGDRLYAQRTVTTACGKGRSMLFVADFASGLGTIDSVLPVRASDILELMKQFNHRSELFQNTGGVHSCALAQGSDLLVFEEDIGRHNALDKILGQAMRSEMPLQDKMVLTSGRISSEIVAKVARRKIPLIVSRSAPTSAAIEQAKELGMTLIGFARGGRFNIYTNFSCLQQD